MEEDKSRKRKRGRPPTKKEALYVVEKIKVIEKANDEDSAKKKEQEDLIREQQEQKFAEIERIRIAQERVNSKLRENLEKKEQLQKKEKVKFFLEAPAIKGSKITWKSINEGNKIQGYVNDKLIFEIIRGLNLFSLYIRDKDLISEKKLKSYYGCSTNLLKLKFKSDKLI